MPRGANGGVVRRACHVAPRAWRALTDCKGHVVALDADAALLVLVEGAEALARHLRGKTVDIRLRQGEQEGRDGTIVWGRRIEAG